MAHSKKCIIIFSILSTLVLTLVFFVPSKSKNSENQNPVPIGGDFTLTNQFGENFSSSSLKGKYSFMFFGFTNCPAICPGTLSTFSKTINSLSPKKQNKLNFTFITVDPERDTVSVLKQYMSNFHKKIIALTGSVAEIEDVKTKFKIYSKKNFMNGKEFYMVDHSTLIYLFDRQGNYIDHFPYDVKSEEILLTLQKVL
jgi:protein SCO1/2